MVSTLTPLWERAGSGRRSDDSYLTISVNLTLHRTASNNPVAPIPPPTHMVTMP
jgi:hypothetical protein